MIVPTLQQLLAAHPSLPAPSGGFEQPWQATVFALTVQLHERGVFTWPQWAHALGARLPDSASVNGAQTTGYFEAWAAALGDVLEHSGAVAPGDIDRLQARWHEAAARTPHGRPIELDRLD